MPRRIRKVAVVQVEACVLYMGVLIDLLDPACVERGGAALDAVDFVSLLQQQGGQIGSVLTRDSREQRDFRSQAYPLFLVGNDDDKMATWLVVSKAFAAMQKR